MGDGTTSVVLLAGEILKHVKGFVEDGLHPQVSEHNATRRPHCVRLALHTVVAVCGSTRSVIRSLPLETLRGIYQFWEAKLRMKRGGYFFVIVFESR